MTKKTVTLTTADGGGAAFDLDSDHAALSVTLKHMMEDTLDDVIRVPNVSRAVLSMVVEYMSACGRGDAFKLPDDVGRGLLLRLIVAADFLDIRGLLDVACDAAADLLRKSKSRDETRRLLNMTNDDDRITREEEVQLRTTHSWAFLGCRQIQQQQ